MAKLIISDEIDDQKWDAFIDAHPQGNIFQTSAMFRVFEKTRGYKPYRFWTIKSKTQKVLGVLQGVVVSEKGGLIGQLSARAIIQGGPLVSLDASPDITRDLVNAFDKEVGAKAIWSEIRNLSDTGATLAGVETYHFEDHLNYLNDLRQSEDEMWKKVRPTRRKNILCGRSFNRLIIPKDQQQIDVIYGLLRETYKRVHLPLAHSSLFKAVNEELIPKGLAKIFLAKHGSSYSGGRLILIYKKTLYDWYAGARTAAIPYCPNDFLVWEIFQWGRQNGYEVFDFGGAGKPNVPYGPRDFKRQFGGELVNFGWPFRIYSPWKYYVAHTGLKVYQWIMKQLQGGKS